MNKYSTTMSKLQDESNVPIQSPSSTILQEELVGSSLDRTSYIIQPDDLVAILRDFGITISHEKLAAHLKTTFKSIAHDQMVAQMDSLTNPTNPDSKFNSSNPWAWQTKPIEPQMNATQLQEWDPDFQRHNGSSKDKLKQCKTNEFCTDLQLSKKTTKECNSECIEPPPGVSGLHLVDVRCRPAPVATPLSTEDLDLLVQHSGVKELAITQLGPGIVRVWLGSRSSAVQLVQQMEEQALQTRLFRLSDLLKPVQPELQPLEDLFLTFQLTCALYRDRSCFKCRSYNFIQDGSYCRGIKGTCKASIETGRIGQQDTWCCSQCQVFNLDSRKSCIRCCQKMKSNQKVSSLPEAVKHSNIRADMQRFGCCNLVLDTDTKEYVVGFKEERSLLSALEYVLSNKQFVNPNVASTKQLLNKMMLADPTGFYCLEIVPGKRATLQELTNDMIKKAEAGVASYVNSFTNRRPKLAIDRLVYVQYYNKEDAQQSYLYLRTKYADVQLVQPFRLVKNTAGHVVLEHCLGVLDKDSVKEHWSRFDCKIEDKGKYLRMCFNRRESLQQVYNLHSHDPLVSFAKESVKYIMKRFSLPASFSDLNLL